MGLIHSLSPNEKRVLRCIGASEPLRLLEVEEKAGVDQQDFMEALNQLLRAGLIESSPIREHIHLSELAQTFVNLNRAYAHGLRDLFVEQPASPASLWNRNV